MKNTANKNISSFSGRIPMLVECIVFLCCLAYNILASFYTPLKSRWAVLISGVIMLAAMALLIWQMQQRRLNKSNFERDSLLLAMHNVYPTAILFDLTKDTYRYFPSAGFAVSPVPRTGCYSELIKTTTADVQAEYQEAFASVFSREAMLQRFADGEDSLVFEYRQMGKDGAYHWLLTYVYRVDAPRGGVQAICIERVNDEAKANEDTLREALQNKDRELTDIYRSLTNGIVKAGRTPDYPILFANQAFFDMAGYTREQFIEECGNSLSYITFPADGKDGGKGYEQLTPGMRASGRYRIVRRDGGLLWVRYDATVNEQETSVYYVMFTDISAAVAAEQKLLEQQYYRDLADDYMRGCILIYSSASSSVPCYVSGNVFSLTGYTPEELKRFYKDNFKQLIHPEDGDYVVTRHVGMLQKNAPSFQTEFRVYRKDGTLIWLMNQATRATGYNGETVYVCMYTDVTLQHQREDEAISRMEKDPLTGVLIRTAFEESVAALLQAGDGRSHALIMLDIDDFKRVNDTQGHCAGDAALKAIAETLRKTLRSQDMIGRLGGDEFMMLMQDIPDEETLSDRCAALCGNISTVLVNRHKVTASLGAVCFASGEPGVTFQSLYACMDSAMYEAKRNGKNGYCVFAAHMHDRWAL